MILFAQGGVTTVVMMMLPVMTVTVTSPTYLETDLLLESLASLPSSPRYSMIRLYCLYMQSGGQH